MVVCAANRNAVACFLRMMSKHFTHIPVPLVIFAFDGCRNRKTPKKRHEMIRDGKFREIITYVTQNQFYLQNSDRFVLTLPKKSSLADPTT